jgi:hypothetical protein
MLQHDKSVPAGAQLIRFKERRQGTGRFVENQTRATMSMAWLAEPEQDEAFRKVAEIYLLRKKGLLEDETAKRLTLAGTICS